VNLTGSIRQRRVNVNHFLMFCQFKTNIFESVALKRHITPLGDVLEANNTILKSDLISCNWYINKTIGVFHTVEKLSSNFV